MRRLHIKFTSVSQYFYSTVCQILKRTKEGNIVHGDPNLCKIPRFRMNTADTENHSKMTYMLA